MKVSDETHVYVAVAPEMVERLREGIEGHLRLSLNEDGPEPVIWVTEFGPDIDPPPR